jgi:hypothetical protein
MAGLSSWGVVSKTYEVPVEKNRCPWEDTGK